MPRHSTATASFAIQVVLVFIITVPVFLFLRTSDYLAVDGALRALQVYQLGRPFLHGNNHLLHPFNVYLWSVLLRALEIHPSSPFGFLAVAQAMNAIAAASFLTILYGLCYKLTNRTVVASLVTIGYGLSRAFLAHATNSAEPIVGLLWSAVSIALTVYGIARSKDWAGIAGGLVLALAMATYQSMVVVAVPIVFLIWKWPGGQIEDRKLRARLFSELRFVTAFFLGILTIYATAYYLSGTRTPAGMASRFLFIPASGVYAGITPVKTVAVLAGLAYALFPCLPRECSGFRCLSEGQYRSWIPVAGLAVIFAGLLLMAMVGLAKSVWSVLAAMEKVVITCCALGVISTAVPLMFWMPTYDKLWLQPLAFLVFGTGILLNVAWRVGTRIPIVGRRARWGYALVILVGLPNLGRALYLSVGPTPHLAQAQEVAAIVKPTDLLVGDWNEIFLLYQAFWGPRANSFNLETEADGSGSSSGTLARLSDMIARRREAGGNVYFLELLDLSEGDWKRLIGGKRGIPYDQFDGYRRCGLTVRSFPYRGRIVTFRRLSACAPTLAESRWPGRQPSGLLP